MIRDCEKVILIHGGREKVIWVGGRRKVNGAGGCGPRKSNTHILLLITFFICAVSFRNKLVIFYYQAIFYMNYNVFQLQGGSLHLLIIDAS